MFKLNNNQNAFRTTVLFVLFFEILSFLTYSLKIFFDFNSIVFFLIVAGVFLISLYKLKYGLFIAIAELIIGSKGYLFALSIGHLSISIRIGIFCVVMFAWLVWVSRARSIGATVTLIKQNKVLLLLALVYLFGIVSSIFNHNSFSNIFLDANAWLYFLYFFPLLTILTDKEDFNTIKQVVGAGVVVVAIKSLFLLYAFSHQISGVLELYKWGRDTGWGEFTLISGNFYRIFSQSQIFALLASVFLIGQRLFSREKRFNSSYYCTAILFLSLMTTFLSLSRSFWLALAVSTLLMALYALIKHISSWKRLFSIAAYLIILSALSYGLIVAVVNFPFPHVDSSSTDFSKRLQLDAASSTRQNELLPLAKAIVKHPIVGSGWGTAVTYSSNDPRILTKDNPTGAYTTYAFEWGYLDILLKIGLFGLCVYLYFLWQTGKHLFLNYKKNADTLQLSLLFGLIALLIVNIFSPYINHPLGIGFALLLLVSINPGQHQ